MEQHYLTDKEIKTALSDYRRLVTAFDRQVAPDDIDGIKAAIKQHASTDSVARDRFGLHPLVSALDTAVCICDSFGADRNMCLAVILSAISTDASETTLAQKWGDDIAKMVRGLDKVRTLYSRSPSVESENFRKLLLTFAEDIRVIIIMIVDLSLIHISEPTRPY